MATFKYYILCDPEFLNPALNPVYLVFRTLKHFCTISIHPRCQTNIIRIGAEPHPDSHDPSVRRITAVVDCGQLCVRYPQCVLPNFVNDLIDEANFRDGPRRIVMAQRIECSLMLQ